MTLPDRQRWQQLSPLLDELLDLGKAERRARLTELRATDPGLAAELQVMLSAAGQAEQASFLAHEAAPPDVPQATLIGQQIGAYVIEAHLGQGGTGSVWRARRADGRFEAAVAVKLLHLSLVGRAGGLRFAREGAILAQLSHPNIARLMDAGVTAGGQPYLVIELVDGVRIDQHCNTRRLGIDERLALFDHVLSAVAHAHNHLVIHRDIKPNNILVTADGTVKLLDFGIAKLLQDEAADSPVTSEGQRALTPEYAAPEQLQGAPVSTATDVFALGVLLYQLLAERHPTAQDATTAAEVIHHTLRTEPQRLTAALSPTHPDASRHADRVATDRGTTTPRLRKSLSGDLENIVAQAMRKNAGERYQTVAALADDLRRYRNNQPVSARPDSLAYRCGKFVRRHRVMLGAAAMVLLAIAGGVAGTVSQARRAEEQARAAQQQRDRAQRELMFSQASGDFLTFLLEEVSDKPFTTADLLARAEPVLDKQFAGDPAQRVHLALLLSNLYGQSGFREKARALNLRAQLDAKGISDVALQAEIDCLLGMEQGLTGRGELAKPLFDRAITQLRATPDSDRGTLATCLQSRSEVAGASGEGAAALADAQEALSVLQSAGSHLDSQTVVVRATLASALGRMGRGAESVRENQRALEELEALGRGHSRKAVGLLNNLGVALQRSGQTLKAMQAFERALQISRGSGAVEPALEGNYALRLIDLGRPSEAKAVLEHAIAEARVREDERSVNALLAQGARAWCQLRDLAGCEKMLMVSRTGLAKTHPPKHSMVGTLETSQAQLSLARGDALLAREQLQRAMAIFDADDNRNRIGIRALAWLARTEQQLGDLPAAAQHAQRAVKLAREALAGFEHSEWLGSALVAQGLVQQAQGDSAAAQATWRAALIELQDTLGDAAPATEEARRLLAAR